MSDVKHSPATELPWDESRDRRGAIGKRTYSGGNTGMRDRHWRPIAQFTNEQDSAFALHATENYELLVRALKAELAEHERWKSHLAHHLERANNIKALLKSIGEL